MFDKKDIPEALGAVKELFKRMPLAVIEDAMEERLRACVHHQQVMDMGNRICRLADEMERERRQP